MVMGEVARVISALLDERNEAFDDLLRGQGELIGCAACVRELLV